MNKLEEKLKTLLEERETIIAEMAEIKQAYDIRQQRIIEIAGSIKTLQELINDNQNENTNEMNEDVSTTEK